MDESQAVDDFPGGDVDLGDGSFGLQGSVTELGQRFGAGGTHLLLLFVELNNLVFGGS